MYNKVALLDSSSIDSITNRYNLLTPHESNKLQLPAENLFQLDPSINKFCTQSLSHSVLLYPFSTFHNFVPMISDLFPDSIFNSIHEDFYVFS